MGCHYALDLLVIAFNRNPFISNPSIPFVGVALLLMAALPHGEPWARTKSVLDWQVPNWVANGALFLLMTGYTVSGLHKLTASTWVDGTALTHVLNLPIARDNWIRELLITQPTWLIKGATWESSRDGDFSLASSDQSQSPPLDMA